MTKKDFELIASILKNSEHYTGQYAKSSIYKNIVYNFINTLASKNPRFDKKKFLQACGIDNIIVLTDKDHSKEYIEAEEKSFLEECK